MRFESMFHDASVIHLKEKMINDRFNSLVEDINLLTKAKVCDFIESLITNPSRKDCVLEKYRSLTQEFLEFIEKRENFDTSEFEIRIKLGETSILQVVSEKYNCNIGFQIIPEHNFTERFMDLVNNLNVALREHIKRKSFD